MNDLRAQLRARGVFSGDRRGYLLRAVWVVAASALSWFAFFMADTLAHRAIAALLAGYAGVQASAIAHEAGHGAIARSRVAVQIVGHFFMTCLIGVSYTAWVNRHGSHHLHPNSRKDPDARAGLFSFNETDAGAARGLAGFCTRNQHILLVPLSTLMGFTLKVSSWRHVLRDPQSHISNLCMLLLHFAVWIVLPACFIGTANAIENYLLLTWVEGAYLAFVFLTNHLGGPTTEEAQDWPPALRQIVTARNLPPGALFTHLCIGLNTHIEHHLFGHLPSTRLCEARATTRRMCIAHDIPYRECSVVQAFAEVHRYNMRMASTARRAALQRREKA